MRGEILIASLVTSPDDADWSVRPTMSARHLSKVVSGIAEAASKKSDAVATE